LTSPLDFSKCHHKAPFEPTLDGKRIIKIFQGKCMFQAAKKTFKISDQIIDQIRDAILSGQLKPGDRLASEKELADQFSVAKATMREAMRVLEVLGLIEMRKGVSGGIFIAEVDMRTTIHSIINFLHFQSVSISEITILRYLIEPTVARIAASKITDKDIHNLKKILEDNSSEADNVVSKEIGFHRYLARLTENALLILIVDFVDNLLESIKSKAKLGPDFYQKVRKSHLQILDCIIKKDCPGAARAMIRDLLEVDRYLSLVMGSTPFDPAELDHYPSFKSSKRIKVPSLSAEEKRFSGKKDGYGLKAKGKPINQ
jgi:GntR family transcriptional regulator, transcriptional repressor for pyruvate dehydrogenase complex